MYIVRCAQSRIDQGTLKNEMGIGITRAVGDSSGPSLDNVNGQVWKGYLELLATALLLKLFLNSLLVLLELPWTSSC
jgi:hypothetical protein